MRGRGGEDAAKSLIANLQTKIFHANGHYETNKWAEQLTGDELRLLPAPRGRGPFLRAA